MATQNSTIGKIFICQTYVNHLNNIVFLYNLNNEILIKFGHHGKLEPYDLKEALSLVWFHINRTSGWQTKNIYENGKWVDRVCTQSEEEIELQCKKYLRLF